MSQAKTWGKENKNTLLNPLNTGVTGVSESVDVAAFPNVGIQVVWSTIVGAAVDFEIQTSVDGVNYEQLPGSTFTTSGASGSQTFNVSGLATQELRVAVTSPSTSGSFAIHVTGNDGPHDKIN